MDTTLPSASGSSTPTPANSSTPVWMKRVPMITGVLAGLAGFLTVRSTNMTNQANYNSTHAVLHQAQASDNWSEYQADSVKKNMQTGLASLATDPVMKKKLEDQATEFANRQDPLLKAAKDQEGLRDQELQNSDQKLKVKGLLDYSGMAAQLGIALASVAALTKKKAAYDIGLFAGILAFLITGYALAYPFLMGLIKHG